MFSAITIGGATLDLFIDLQDPQSVINEPLQQFELPIGAKIPVNSAHERFGGGAANTSVGLAKLGANTCFLGVLSCDQWGQAMQKNFADCGVSLDCSTIIEDEVSSFSLIVQSTKKDRTILYTPGCNVHMHDALLDTNALANVDCIYLNHIQKHSLGIIDDIITAVQKRDSVLTWNPGSHYISLGYNAMESTKLLAVTTILQLNKEEALAFTETDTIEHAMTVLKGTSAKYVCITDGANGTYGINTALQELYYCTTLNVDVQDSTGAGDAFGSASTWAILQGLSLPEALQAGTINAASVIQKIGAQPGLLTDIELRQQLSINAPSVTPTSSN